MIEDEELRQNATRIGKFALERLGELERKHELVGDVRGLGLMQALELGEDRETKEPAARVTRELLEAARRNPKARILIPQPCFALGSEPSVFWLRQDAIIVQNSHLHN